MKGFSVIMPTYNQGEFIRRAVLSLIKQSYSEWELIIVDDGSTDGAKDSILDLLDVNSNIIFIRNETNRGMGYAINQGLAIAKYDHIAYLPSDDFYYTDHLKEIKEKFDESPNTVLVYTGMKYDLSDLSGYVDNYETLGFREGYSLQLIQTAHRKTTDKWLERDEWVTDNLSLMFWDKLEGKGNFVATNNITCNWTNHPHQRHKIINEKYGGSVHYYRTYYKVTKPTKIRESDYRYIDQEEDYKKFREPIKPATDSLKILIVGELAYHPDRIYALEEAGHQLYGLWLERPVSSIMMVGPLPFGNVINIPYEGYEDKIAEIKPDIIYGLLSTEAIPLAYDVLNCFPNIPFVWHLKEGPFHAMRMGMWKKLAYLYTHADGNIFINKEVKAWIEQFIPNVGASFILDGDLPKIDYFNNNFTERLSHFKDEVHTVIPGRLVGIFPNHVQILAKENIHIHIYTENYHHQKLGYIFHLKQLAPNHIHLHHNCAQTDWVKEFSQYDAGWLHCINSQNHGNLLNAIWDDLNMPARMTTLAAAGLPMIQKDNTGHTVAMQNIIRQKDVGIFFNDIEDLCNQLKDKKHMNKLRYNILEKRYEFSFDYHLPNLISFFRKVISKKKGEIN